MTPGIALSIGLWVGFVIGAVVTTLLCTKDPGGK